MPEITLITDAMHHCGITVSYLLDLLRIKHTKYHLSNALNEHPDFSSLQSIADVLGSSYDVSTLAIKISIEDLIKTQGVNPPMIAQIKSKKADYEVFAVITSLTNNQIKLFNPGRNRVETYTLNDFKDIYQGKVLLVEPGDIKHELDYHSNLSSERRNKFLKNVIFIIFPALILLITLIQFRQFNTTTIVTTILFSFLAMAGAFFTILMVGLKIDKTNLSIKKFCRTSERINCSEVLNSKASEIKGFYISGLGAVFFLGTLLSFLISGFFIGYFVASAWITLLAVPLIFFSVIYQWKIAKHWCVLCLAVMGILALQITISYFAGWYSLNTFKNVSINTWVGLLSSLSCTFLISLIVIPSLEKNKQLQKKNISLRRIKYNPEIFNELLKRQKSIPSPSERLGIQIGNRQAQFKLIKVCNPYCKPCAESHPAVESLIHDNEDVSLQIIFNASEDDRDPHKAPVAHFLSLAESNNTFEIKTALNTWYTAEKKDYNTFAQIHPVDISLINNQDQKIEAMRKWCGESDIGFTPTFFIGIPTTQNGIKSHTYYQIPEYYTVGDLKYFFTI